MKRKIGVNDPCSCGSGKKYKKCCRGKDSFNESIENIFGSKILQKTVDGVQYTFKPLSICKLDEFDEFKEDKRYEDMSWYFALCNKQEISRIFDIKTTDDYLLKIRADSVLDNMRLNRVMMTRKNADIENWSFSKQFNDRDFNLYLHILPDYIRDKCSNITKGYVFCDDANGSLMRSNVGDLIIVSEALRYFFFYMNLFSLDFKEKIPVDIRLAALRIALRVMLQTESMDFELDERGNIPNDIKSYNNYLVSNQLQFVIGHEYAHYYYDHLDKNNLYSRSLLNSENKAKYIFYNHMQIQEFEADLASVSMPLYDKDEFDQHVMAGIYFFAYLHLYEKAKEQIFPSMNHIKTHPPAIDRLLNLYDKTQGKLAVINKSA